MKRFHALPLLTLLTFIMCGCTLPRPLKGGKAFSILRPSGGAVQTLSQGENPSQPSTQEQETTRTYTFPSFPNSSVPVFQNSNFPVSVVEHTRARTELGA